ncbi:hypothetical protein CYMTET_20739 [Cymbomonas tetramitiformis]|uniref:Sulfotransferase n=1 Tax=Cymbomonas tetramitiformis TaxID=36881 RepID=A0AAE0G3K7_9CHLO|nr:hypothetical protein CYMTET_20739 [Cymbomonas tetramitiformis]
MREVNSQRLGIEARAPALFQQNDCPAGLRNFVTNQKAVPPSESLDEGDVIYFVHVPRTAGRTFHQCFLKVLFPAPQHCPQSYDIRDFASHEDKAEFRTCKLMASHEDFSTVERLQAMRKPTVVTQLRDPVDRVLSAYEFAVEVALRNLKGKPRKQEEQAPDGKKTKRKVETTDVYPWSEVVPWMREYLRKKPVLQNAGADTEDSDDSGNEPVDSYNNTFLMPLHEFIQHQVVIDHIHNGATVQFAGLTTRSLHEEWQTMRNCSEMSSKNNELLLQLAMHRLQSFAFVGLTERIDDNGRLMAAMRGYDLSRPSPEVEWHEVDRKKGSISDRYHQCVDTARSKYKRNRENTFKAMNLPFRFSKEARQSISQATLDLIGQYNQAGYSAHPPPLQS